MLMHMDLHSTQMYVEAEARMRVFDDQEGKKNARLDLIQRKSVRHPSALSQFIINRCASTVANASSVPFNRLFRDSLASTPQTRRA